MFRDTTDPNKAVHVLNVVMELTDYEKGQIVYDNLYDESKTIDELANEYDVSRKKITKVIDRYEEIEPTFPALEPTLKRVYADE